MLRLSYLLGSVAVIAALVAAGLYTWKTSVANAVPPQAAVSEPAAAASAPAPAPAPAAAAASAVPEAALTARGTDLAKLVFSQPRPVSALPFTDSAGAQHHLADYKGKWLLVNFWAVWCVPCRVEMPALDQLQSELGGKDFAVLTIAAGRNEPAAVDRFYTENNLSNLPKLFDPKMALAAEMGVPGLPVSVILNPEGQEVGRLIGDAAWGGEAAKAVFRALIEG